MQVYLRGTLTQVFRHVKGTEHLITESLRN